MDGGWEEILYENAKNFNNVCSLYGIAQTFGGNGWLKWRNPPNNDIVAFSWIDREAPIYQSILDIEGVLLQNVALWAWWDNPDVVCAKKRFHIDDTWEDVMTIKQMFVSPGKTKVKKSMQFSLSFRVCQTRYANVLRLKVQIWKRLAFSWPSHVKPKQIIGVYD